ncbi:zinc-binding dehydrogenase [Polynucleobacter sp. SHI8]|uniref:quinone oxidoreductase family protein n=1 Tax=unclassified Polynucleobacter TaxID=2640945 RepID=UPI0024937E6C|nr:MULTISPECIES: zinc-binding alcohol dehydrogenase family protein [unclassified Polynucleobacter]BDW10376.1 zinc-binding dehydrogenase [Polynucleobacter sp. SHI2]BDW12822.1 zinc-binding dehydrogenase [Polynucleobacter sp. SHI8]
MKAAVVLQKDQPPVFADFKNPLPDASQNLVRVRASSISQITKARASVTHYSSDNEVPFIPGFDGVGTLEDGSTVYFLLPQNPFGAMAEYCVVDTKHCVKISQTLSSDILAAMAIPGMSSWAALIDQAKMVPGQTVLINGANGISGRLAIQIAKYLGAGKIIATARRSELFDEMIALGADECIQLTEETGILENSLKVVFQQGVHILLDYLWGPSALSIIQSSAKHSPQGFSMQLVQIGSIGGATIPFPASALRSSGLKVMGSGLGSLSIAQMLSAVSDLIKHAPEAGFQIKTEKIPLSEVSQVWNTTSSDVRTVLMI